MPILITGASGFIGRFLTGKLLERRTPIRVVTRHPDRLPPEWGERVEVVAGSLTDTDTIKMAVSGVSHVFHLAGELSDVEIMESVNIGIARELVRAAGAAGAKRFIHLSSVGVIGADGDKEVTEEAPCRPKNQYERTKLAGERAILEFSKKAGFDAVIVRPTIVFGEGVNRTRDSLLEWMRAVQAGRFLFIGRNAVANYVYVGDVADALLRLSERPCPGGEIFHVADPAPMRDFVWAMAEALGVPCPTRTVPFWAAYAAGAGLEAAHRLFGTPAPLTRARARALSSGCRFGGSKMQTYGGLKLPYGYRTGLERTVRWYRETGEL